MATFHGVPATSHNNPMVHILPPDIVAKIAAGEVIDRPASVIKELMENALDAGADSVEIAVNKAGRVSVTVKDDGSGIAEDDLKKIFSRHATSKISSLDDLFDIRSLGFRGEALYSIAAVADVVMQSRPRGQENGFEVHRRGGEELAFRPLSMTPGTTVEVKELFFNTPARKKFLKADQAELNQILGVFIPYTLLYPDKRFVLVHNGRTMFDLMPDKSRKERAAQALNLEAGDMIETERRFPEAGLTLKLLLGNVNIRRARRDQQFIFVNGRPVQHRSLAFHLNQKYRLIFSPDAYPFFVVDLALPASRVDVNVHPAKREVKLKGEQEIFPALRGIIEEVLMNKGDPRRAGPAAGSPKAGPALPSDERDREFFARGGMKKSDYRMPSGTEKPKDIPHYTPQQQEAIARIHAGGTVREFQETFFARPRTSLKEKLAGARYIGPFMNKFLLFESGRSVIFFDQHAAQERIVFEALVRQMAENRVEVQNLLTPVTVRLSPQEILAWDEVKEKAEEMGFSCTMFDEETVALQSHPRLIRDPALALRCILAGEDIAAADNETIARRACRRSVMTGDPMKPEQADHQRKELLKCADPFTCPHGRPTLIEITEDFLDRQFLRK